MEGEGQDPEYRVNDQYKTFFKKDFRLRQRGKPGLDAPQGAFGTWTRAEDIEGGGQQLEVLPIEGPPNVDQIFEFGTIGMDARHKLLRAPKTPLDKSERKYLKRLELMQPFQQQKLLRNITFENVLAEGKHGQVWVVSLNQGGTPKAMACKVLKPIIVDADHFQDTMDHLLSDMRILRFLNHENICKMEDMISIPDRKTGFPYSTVLTFLELCDGDLFNLLADTPPDYLLAEPLSRHWFRQIALAVKYLHEQRICHLDIKPENIYYVYIDESKRKSLSRNPLDMIFKLGDFGLSKAFLESEDYMLDEMRGTEIYQPIEMRGVMVDKAHAKKCDIFCLGATLARSLIGREDFFYYSEIIHNQMVLAQDRNTSNFNISPEAAFLISAMTNYNSRIRPDIDTILNRYEWMTNTNITNPRHVRAEHTIFTTIAGAASNLPGIAAVPGLVGAAVGAAYLITRFLR